MSEPIKSVLFSGKTYSEADLAKMQEKDLLELRNLVAVNLGASKINAFKDLEAAKKLTWSALVKFAESSDDDLASKETKAEAKEKKAKEKKEKVPPGYLKSIVPKRPTKKQFSKIKKLRNPVEGSDRSFAWPDYKDGMTVLDTMLDPKLHHDKVYWWASRNPPYIQLIEPTEEEYQAALAKFYKDQGIQDPAAERNAKKAARAKEKEEKKAKREAEKAAKKAEKEKASEEAKAKREAEEAKTAKPVPSAA